ncbi:hypothetical protein H206_05325 [Candidatus Electrothrix aarhusensis]|uniref:Uncharacterized protein n=1 Tax=Candidatus Electrothrix aarhusensis TaxID=1859131 RepID=A0A3S3QLW6_9BACT|nr:hypothetical protein H206_05325 [Candidatus Electrothrix aarhusensis]
MRIFCVSCCSRDSFFASLVIVLCSYSKINNISSRFSVQRLGMDMWRFIY